MATKRLKTTKKICDRWAGGLCRMFRDVPVRCPLARAQNCPPGACCHHPLSVMSRGGVNLRRYGRKILDPEFVDKLYSVFEKRRQKGGVGSRGASD